MNSKRISMTDFISMNDQKYAMVMMCIESKNYRLLGCNWKKWVETFVDPKTGDFVIEYE